MTLLNLDSGTEYGMPRAWAFCCGRMPREDRERESEPEGMLATFQVSQGDLHQQRLKDGL